MAIKTPLKVFNMRRALLYLFPLVIILAAAVWLPFQFEWRAPTIKIKLDTEYIGSRPFHVEINDKGRGLKEVSISLLAAGVEHPIVVEHYDRPVKTKDVAVTLSRETLNLKGGRGVLRVTATDRSYWNFFKGNTVTLEKDVIVDLTPPRIQLITGDRYINFGGSGLVIYQTSPDIVRSGVQIGDYFFPGYKGPLKILDAYMAYFAHPHDVPPDTKGSIVAEDAAGNVTERALHYTLKNIRIRKKRVNVTDRLIERAVVPLLGRGASRGKGLKDLFIEVNRDMRQENGATIREVCSTSIDSMLWDLPFHQLTNSKVEANFADERTYIYQDEVIDHAFHLGYDLAVTKNYPIEAANNGVVAFGGDLGIYGNTVIIDHGLGLFTLYSHMSLMGVKKGETVKRKQIIGKTGQTGLTTGDHLHYATMLHGVPVLPLEWWDGRWVDENILSKIRFVIGRQPVASRSPQVKESDELTVLDTVQQVQRKKDEMTPSSPVGQETIKEESETQTPMGPQ